MWTSFAFEMCIFFEKEKQFFYNLQLGFSEPNLFYLFNMLNFDYDDNQADIKIESESDALDDCQLC